MRTIHSTAEAIAHPDADGYVWLVGEGAWPKMCPHADPTDCNGEHCDCPLHPPVEFVQASAPCPNLVHRDGGFTDELGEFVAVTSINCPDCRIELVGPCCGADDGYCFRGDCSRRDGTVTLGYAYAVGEPLPIILGWSRPDGNSSGDVLSFWKGHYGPDLVMQRAWNATAIQTRYADRTATLAHYGPPESLVGKWVLRLQVV